MDRAKSGAAQAIEGKFGVQHAARLIDFSVTE
jgi:hypothetical protein